MNYLKFSAKFLNYLYTDVISFFYMNFPDGFSEFSSETQEEWTKRDDISENITILEGIIESSEKENLLEKWNQFVSENNLHNKIGTDFNEMENTNWYENWKQYFKPLEIGKKLVVKPSWEDYNSKEDKIIIEIDPQNAFGTGQNDTTKFCLELIEMLSERINEKVQFLDFGTGSGILSIAACKLFKNIEINACDIDEDALHIAEQNFQINNLHCLLNTWHGDMNKEKKNYTLIAANIVMHKLIPCLNDLLNLLDENGYIIFSGVLKEEKAEFIKHIKKISDNTHLVHELTGDEWWAGCFQKKT